LQLEADGEVLQRAVQLGLHNNGNGASAEHELDADGDVLKEAVKSKSPSSAIVDSTSMEEVDVSSLTNNENGDRDENGGGGIV
jgi:hypothetical protein